MLSSKLKNFAMQKGMKISNGICYGNINGFTVTFCERRGSTPAVKELYIATSLTQEMHNYLESELSNSNAFKKYKLNKVDLNKNVIYIAFLDSMGSIKRFEEFIDWFMPLLLQSGAPGEDICPECGNPIQGDGVKKLLGGHAVCMHNACAQALINNIKEEEEEIKTQSPNAGKGFLGSVIFGLLATIPWAVIYALGWFVAWLGALIGAAVVKGYTMFGGKLKKSVIPFMAVLVIVLVVFATFFGDVIQVEYYISKGELSDEYSIFEYMSWLFEDSEYIAVFIKNALIGILFAALGVWGIFRNLIKDVSSVSKTIVDLE